MKKETTYETTVASQDPYQDRRGSYIMMAIVALSQHIYDTVLNANASGSSDKGQDWRPNMSLFSKPGIGGQTFISL